jgi:serine/threonine protein kinase
VTLAAEQQLFEYRIVRPLGQGAFDIVYLAHNTLLDRLVAIKELAGASRTDDVALRI